MNTILLVDSDKYYSGVFQQLLKLDGYEVVYCDSGSRALRFLQDKSFQVAIVDYHLPGMNGDEVSRLMRAQSPDTIIVGFSLDSKEDAFLESGADAFYHKDHVRELLSWIKLVV